MPTVGFDGERSCMHIITRAIHLGRTHLQRRYALDITIKLTCTYPSCFVRSVAPGRQAPTASVHHLSLVVPLPLQSGPRAPPSIARGPAISTRAMKRSHKEAFPAQPNATQEEFRAVCAALCDAHGQPVRSKPAADGCGGHASVLDSLVRTILSQNTTDTTSARAFASLKQAFPTWEAVRLAPTAEVAASIKVGGLADIKAGRIQVILQDLHTTRGACCLEHLRAHAVEDIKATLTRYPGVGPKTVACVLMFCLGREEFPVDTHVWEMSKQLGWVPPGASREDTYGLLNGAGGVPPDIKYDLHVLMVQHGKVCRSCAKTPAAGRANKGKAGSSTPTKQQFGTAGGPGCPLQLFKKKYRHPCGSSAAVGPLEGQGSLPAAAVKQEQLCERDLPQHMPEVKLEAAVKVE